MLIHLANGRTNPLESLPDFDEQMDCLHRQVNSSDVTNVQTIRIVCKKWAEVDEETQNWMADLTEANMGELYRNSNWGWNRSSKMGELKHDTARHLLVYSEDQENSSTSPIAFVHFRFEEGYCQDASLYCYDLQLVQGVRRRGIGATLMNLLQDLASVHRMKKVLLTVLKGNVEAMKFYTDGLKFVVDKNSPSKCGEVSDYEILSKKVEVTKK